MDFSAVEVKTTALREDLETIFLIDQTSVWKKLERVSSVKLSFMGISKQDLSAFLNRLQSQIHNQKYFYLKMTYREVQ